jgi:hypothetical protein
MAMLAVQLLHAPQLAQFSQIVEITAGLAALAGMGGGSR